MTTDIQYHERTEAKRLGLTLPAYHLLCMIQSNPGKTMTEYCQRMLQSNAATCSLLERLSTLGYISAERSKHDRRKWKITATI